MHTNVLVISNWRTEREKNEKKSREEGKKKFCLKLTSSGCHNFSFYDQEKEFSCSARLSSFLLCDVGNVFKIK